MEKHLHIICLNVPYPVDYGGVFDLYYKLPALHSQGVKIHLHCFEYGRGEQPVLNQFCEAVYYYKRKTGLSAFSFKYPYIVSSRKSEALLNRLAADDYPILMEGVHCTALLCDKRFENRRCFVRLHNVEHIYYRYLYHNPASFFKKLYYGYESKLLKSYEKAIATKALFITVSTKDAEVYKSLGADAIYLRLFLPNWKLTALEGKGCFCLYQGDLSITENEQAVAWLVENVFSRVQVPFVVAGKKPSGKLKQLLHDKPSTCLVENPSEAEMQDLIAKAQVNIIPSYNTTGIKLKLLNALYNGRHCLVNKTTVEGTGLEECCHVADTAKDFAEYIIYLYGKPFSPQLYETRHLLLKSMFDNQENAIELIRIIWGSSASQQAFPA